MKGATGIIVKTGDICPSKGIWKVLENPSFAITIEGGDVIPPFQGRSVSWELLKTSYPQYASDPVLSFFEVNY